MTTIAQLGVKITSEGIGKTEKELDKLTSSSLKSQKAIDAIIESVKKQNIALKEGKQGLVDYLLITNGASKAERELASNILKSTEKIKAAKKEREGLVAAEKKRQDSINAIILKLRDEVAVLGKSDSELLRYKLTLLGATDAEKKQAAALQNTIKEYEKANVSANNHNRVLTNVTKSVIALALAYVGISSIKKFANSLVETAIIADNYKYSLQAVSDTNEIAAKSYLYLKEESERLGLSIKKQGDSFVSFAASAKAAGLTVAETKSNYTGLNEAFAALHRSPEQAASAMAALEQMLSKGTVQSEELVRQLSNSVPGAVPLFAQAMGVTVSELRKLMEQGILPANEAINVFSNFLSHKFQKAAENASKGTQGSINKMQNAVFEFKETLVKALGDEGIGVISAFTEEVKKLTTHLSSPEGQEALKNFAKVIGAIAKAAIWAASEISTMASNFYEIMEFGKKIKDAKALDEEYTLTFAINQEQRKKNAEENLRISEEQLVKDKEKIQVLIKNHKIQKEDNIERKNNQKDLDKMFADEIKRSEQIGKTNAEKMRMDALALGATKEQAAEIYNLVKASDAREKAIEDGIKAERAAIAERERIREKEIALETARQERIDKIIEKLKEEIATYKKGDEVSSEYALRQENATESEIQLAIALGKTLNALKAKTKAQTKYNAVMNKVAPDKNELNREIAINATNEAFETGAIVNEEYANSLKKINDYYDKIEEKAANKRIEDITKELDNLTSFDGSTFGNTIADGINNAVTSMNNLLEVYDKNEKAQKKIAALQAELATGKGSPQERENALKAIDKAETAMIKNQISAYRELFGTTSQLYEENSKERKALHNAEMAFAAIEIAMNTTKAISLGVVAVINAMSSGDPYTAIARGLAVAATVAAALSQIGGTFSFDGSSSSSSPEFEKATSATGTVFGDSTASSESVKNIEEFFEDMHVEDYTQLKGIYSEVKDLNDNITGLVSTIFTEDVGFSADDMGINTDSVQSNFAQASDKLFEKIQESMDKVFMSFIDPLTVLTTGFAGKISNYLISGLFGGEITTSIEEQGITTTAIVSIGELISGATIDAVEYATVKIEEDGGWFGSDSTSYKRVTKDLGSEIDSIFTLFFKDLGESFVDIAETLGKDVASVEAFAFEIGDIDLKNLETADEINEAISAALSGISDEAATELFGELIGQYQTVGEGMFETAVRVASEKIVVLETIDALGASFKNADVPALAIEFSQSLIDLAGDLETFIEETSAYYDAFFTDAEKHADVSEFLTTSLSELTSVLPETRDSYRDFVSSLDLTTESGQSAFTTLVGLSEKADEYYSYLEDIESRRLDYEIEILELQGKAEDALTLSRKDELDAIEDSLKPLQEHVWALQDLESVESDYLSKLEEELSTLEGNLESAKSDYVSKLNEELSALEGNLESAKSDYIEMLNDEESVLSDKLNDAKSTYVDMLNEEAEKTDALVTSIKDAIESLQEYRESLFDNYNEGALKKDYLSAKQKVLANSVSSGNVSDVSELISVSDQYLETSKETSRTSIDYKREVARTNALLYSVQENLGEQLTEAEMTAQAFDELISGINGVDNTVLSLAQAESLYNDARTEFENNKFSKELEQFEETMTYEKAQAKYYAAKTELDNNWYEAELEQFEEISTIEELRTAYYAAKTELDNNWYEAEIDALSDIEDAIEDLKIEYYSEKTSYDEKYGSFASGGYNPGGLSLIGEKGPELSYRPPSQIMSNSDMLTELSTKQVVSELQELRAELAKANFAIAKNTQEAAKTLKKFDYDGMPETRE